MFRNNDAFHLDLGEMLPRPLPDDELADVAKIADTADKQRVFDAAEKLGVALMASESAVGSGQ